MEGGQTSTSYRASRQEDWGSGVGLGRVGLGWVVECLCTTSPKHRFGKWHDVVRENAKKGELGPFARWQSEDFVL